MPAQSYSDLAVQVGRDAEGELVLFCLIRVQSATTISDPTGWRRATQFGPWPTIQSVLQVYSQGQEPMGVNTNSME